MNLVVADTRRYGTLSRLVNPACCIGFHANLGSPAALWPNCAANERPASFVHGPDSSLLGSKFERSETQRGETRAVWIEASGKTIQPARKIHADPLLIDERAGARFSRELGFAVTGTLAAC